MILKTFSIYDNKAMAFRTPFYLHMEGEAIRAFADMVNDPEHPVGQHPEDYTLFLLGDFNDQSAKQTNYDTPKSLGLAIEHKKPEMQFPLTSNELQNALDDQAAIAELQNALDAQAETANMKLKNTESIFHKEQTS